MNKLKQALVATGAIALSASLFVLTLPLVLFMTSALFLTGVAGALVLRYQMRKQAKSRTPVDVVVIEGSYRTDQVA